MKKSSIRTLILLLPILAVLTGLMTLPAICLAQANLSAVMSLDKGPVIQAGDSVTVTLTPSGGHPPYAYKHVMIVYEQGEPHYFSSENNPDSSYTWTVNFGDSVLFKSYVRDVDCINISCESTLTVQGSVYNPLTISSESLSPGDVINVGDTITYSITAQGGQPPYTYSYRLEIAQYNQSELDSWSVPINTYDYSCSSNSFTYTVTRGNEGLICSGVRDALGRDYNPDSYIEFTILGDDHAPMDIHTKQSVTTLTTGGILGNNKYRMTINASVKAGTQPITFYCLWDQYKDGVHIDRVLRKCGDGRFSLEGNFYEVEALVWAIDADGWRTNRCTITFDPSINKRPFPFDWFKNNPRGIALREDLLNLGWEDLTAQLLNIPGIDPSPDPVLDAFTPELVQLELIKPKTIESILIKPPEATAPVTEGPKTVQPGLLQPLITTKPPALKLPNLPKP